MWAPTPTQSSTSLPPAGGGYVTPWAVGTGWTPSSVHRRSSTARRGLATFHCLGTVAGSIKPVVYRTPKYKQYLKFQCKFWRMLKFRIMLGWNRRSELIFRYYMFQDRLENFLKVAFFNFCLKVAAWIHAILFGLRKSRIGNGPCSGRTIWIKLLRPLIIKTASKSFGWDIVVTQSHLCADCPAALISFGQPGLKQGRQAPESEDYNMGMSQNRCPFFPIQKYIFGPEKAQFPRHSHIDLRSGWGNHIIASTCS